MSQPHFNAPQPTPPGKNDWLLRALVFYVCIYAVLIILVALGYLVSPYVKPLAQFIFPINQHNSIGKTFLVGTGMYWGMVGIFILINRGKTPEN